MKHPNTLTIRRAWSDDLDTVLALIREVTRWMISRGIHQWDNSLTDAVVPYFARKIGQDTVYLAELDGQPVGTLTFQWSDRTTWDDIGEDGQAGYMHSLATARRAAGHGLGASLLEWAMAQVCRHDRPYLRLDCAAENAGLCRYYTGLGFIEKGIKETPSWRSRLFEKSVGREARDDHTHFEQALDK